jgi:hypothetical protein
MEALRNPRWKQDARNRPGLDALSIENRKLTGVSRAVVNKADKPAFIRSSAGSRGQGELARRPAFPEIVVLGFAAGQIVAQQAAKGAVFQIAIVRERVDDAVRPAGVAIVDAGKLDLLIVELLLLRFAGPWRNAPPAQAGAGPHPVRTPRGLILAPIISERGLPRNLLPPRLT